MCPQTPAPGRAVMKLLRGEYLFVVFWNPPPPTPTLCVPLSCLEGRLSQPVNTGQHDSRTKQLSPCSRGDGEDDAHCKESCAPQELPHKCSFEVIFSSSSAAIKGIHAVCAALRAPPSRVGFAAAERDPEEVPTVQDVPVSQHSRDVPHRLGVVTQIQCTLSPQRVLLQSKAALLDAIAPS